MGLIPAAHAATVDLEIHDAPSMLGELAEPWAVDTPVRAEPVDPAVACAAQADVPVLCRHRLRARTLRVLDPRVQAANDLKAGACSMLAGKLRQRCTAIVIDVHRTRLTIVVGFGPGTDRLRAQIGDGHEREGLTAVGLRPAPA